VRIGDERLRSVGEPLVPGVYIRRCRVVLVARPELLLAMTLCAGRGLRDAGDIDRLLEACGITSVAGAKRLFDRFYPAEDIAAPAMRQLHARLAGTD